MRVTMVARDLAPSRALESVRKELLAEGVAVSAHICNEKPLASSPETILEDVRHSDLLFLGMSSSSELAKEEILAAREAMRCGSPYGFYADFFGTSSRAHFEPFRESARFVFVMSEEEARKTRLIFPKAEVLASGNPVLEGAFTVSKSNAEVRELLGVGSDELLLYCTAGKDLEVNRIHFEAVVKAVSRLSDRKRWKIFFMLHPRDQNDPSAYADVVQSEEVTTRLVSANDTKSIGFVALDLIGACDLMVAAVSTSGIEAACLRKPVIDFLSPPGVKRMKDQTGSDVWPPCEFGVSRAVMGDPIELSRAISDLMSADGFREMRARQEACFPMPKMRGAAVQTMTATLLKLLS